MKTLSFILLAALGYLAAGCGFYHQKVEIREEAALPSPGITKLRVTTRNGRIAVRCREGSGGIKVQSTRFARGRNDEEARERAASIPVDMERDAENAGLLRLVADIGEDLARHGAGVHFEVEMPPGADLQLETANGEVAVEGARGRVDIKTSNGRLELKDVRGPVEARTSNGEIAVTGVRGDMDLKTSNGAITLKTESLPPRPRIRADTSNGAVHVEVPSSVRAKLALRTRNGGIDERLAGATVSGLETSRGRLEAVLNGGGGEIVVETSNGKITFETVQ